MYCRIPIIRTQKAVKSVQIIHVSLWLDGSVLDFFVQKASGSRTAPGVGFSTFLLLGHIRISVSMRAVRTDDVLTKNGDVIILFECFEKTQLK